MFNDGIDVTATRIGCSHALDSAAYYDHAFIKSSILENGTNLGYGGTESHAIYAAASDGYREIVQVPTSFLPGAMPRPLSERQSKPNSWT